jgi:hypothetical protein
MNKDEAPKLALDALKKTHSEGYNLPGTAIEEAITAIKQARSAQQEHEPENEPHVSLASVREDWGPGPHEYHSLPAPVQETPFQIGQRLRQEGKGISDLWGAVSSDADMPEAQRGFDEVMRLAPVQPVQEADVFDDDIEVTGPTTIRTRYRLEAGAKLYTTPPAAQRQWVGLTDEEKHKPDMGKYVYLNDDWLDGYKTGMEYAEAKLKEKNT